MSVLWKIVGRSYAYGHLCRNLALFETGVHHKTAISTTTTLQHSHSDDSKSLDENSPITGTVNDIPKDRLTIKFARSSGPGGQNVNKVNTKADVRFHVQSADWLSQEVRDKLVQLEKNRINRTGELVVSSTKFRSQTRNLEDAIEKVADMVKKASHIPEETTPQKKARVRKLIRKANERRLAEKKFRSSKKSDRKMEV